MPDTKHVVPVEIRGVAEDDNPSVLGSDRPSLKDGDRLPLDGETRPAEPQPQAPTTKPGSSPRIEYVSGSGYAYLANYIRALPQYIDDITKDFGDDIYERMMIDDQVSKCVNVLKLDAIGGGYYLKPTIERPSPKSGKKPIPGFDYDLAEEIRDSCTAELEQLERPFDEWLYEMLDACAFGNKVAEKVYDDGELNDGSPGLLLKRLKTKPRNATSFVVDVFNNVIGLLGIVPGQGAPILAGSIIGDPISLPNFLPRDKFAVLTINPKDSDPRGKGLLRPAYDPWWRKQQTKQEYLKFLAQAAGASIFATTAPDASSVPELDSSGIPTGRMLDPIEALKGVCEAVRNGSVAVGPHGTMMQFMTSNMDGGAFLQALDNCDDAIVSAILLQKLATEEGQHQTRAATGRHQDLMQDTIQSHIRKRIENMVRQDILRTHVLLNYGEKAAKKYTPYFHLGRDQQADFSEKAGAVATLVSSGFLDQSQYKALDDMIGLPERADNPTPPPDGGPSPDADGNVGPQGEGNGTGGGSKSGEAGEQSTAKKKDTAAPAGEKKPAAGFDASKPTATELANMAQVTDDDQESARKRWRSTVPVTLRHHLGRKGLNAHAKASEAVAAATDTVNTDPTPAQKESGNYAKGHVVIQGLGITIENPAGSVRSGTSPDGSEWSQTMQNHYGYIKRTESESDGDHLDVFLGADFTSDIVFIVNQIKPDGNFDEHKVMLFYRDADAAKAAYLSNYPADWTGFGSIASMSMEEFKQWIADTVPNRAVFGDDGQWITVNGTPVFVGDGQSKEDAIKERFGKGKSGKAGKGADKARGGARKGFHAVVRQSDGSYKDASGKPLPAKMAERIKGLRLPPAWTDVQVSKSSSSALQAIGYDKKGREQRIYSAEHHRAAAAAKFMRLGELVRELPKIEKGLRSALGKPGHPNKEEAAVLLMMRKTGFRIGSETDTMTSHRALGATTLTNKNVKVEGDKVSFSFIGKKGVRINQTIHDKELAKIIAPRLKSSQKVKLFDTTDAKVRDFLRSIDNRFKAKDLRTLVAAETALEKIKGMRPPENDKQYKSAQKEVAKAVARKLGNTPSVALKSYIPPEVFEQWQKKK